jgi:NADPH:quinone reductase-like Zn-dependent oxidoreductase
MTGLAFVERGVELVECPVPVPKRGEVPIHMRAAPINPNDLMFLDDTYEVKPSKDVQEGFRPNRLMKGMVEDEVAAVARAVGKDRMQVHRWVRRFAIDLDQFRS